MMKYIKMLGLAATALATLMAIAGTASAATATSPAGTTYTGTIKAESEGSTSFMTGGFGTVTCHKSTLEGNIGSHGAGVKLRVYVRSVTFTECTGGTVTSPLSERGTLEIDGGGTTQWGYAEVTIHNTLVGTCTIQFLITDIGDITGSSATKGNATLDVWATPSVKLGNPFCPSSAVWQGSYKITTPSLLDID